MIVSFATRNLQGCAFSPEGARIAAESTVFTSSFTFQIVTEITA